MTRSHFVLLTILGAALASAPAEAGRPRGMQVLDRDAVVLPYIEQDNLYRVTYLRGAGGQALLMDESDGSPMRVTPLGFTPPIGSNKGSYTATPDGTVWAAFSSAQGIRVYDLGDLEQPGPLDPLLLDVILAPAAYDPRSVHMGIIAILIGLMAEPRPALAVSDGTSNTMMLGWAGHSFEPVVEVGDGTWTWDRPR